jgi:hypothetical protein
MGDDQGGEAVPGDDVGHGEGFARAGDAFENLEAVPGGQAATERDDGLGLIARGHIGGIKFEKGAHRASMRSRQERASAATLDGTHTLFRSGQSRRTRNRFCSLVLAMFGQKEDWRGLIVRRS